MEESGLVHCFLFDGEGGGRELGWNEINSWSLSEGILWVHLSYTSPDTLTWLEEKSGLEPLIIEALLSEETRPRSTVIGKGVLLNLRGVNHNPGADYEDMVSLRVWAEEHRVITTRKRPLRSVTDLGNQLKKGFGPISTSDFIISITELLTAYVKDALEDIEDKTAELEHQVISSTEGQLRTRISAIRREAIMLRRYLAPQREAVSKLQVNGVAWFTEKDKRHLHEVANSLIHIVEDLDSLRDRATVAQEELVNALSVQLNSRMYMLSIITAIFLPLSFFTGLLGINVGGIPGASYKWAFLVVIFLLLLICTGQFLYFRKKQWL